MHSPQGITTDGVDIWIVSGDLSVRYFQGAAARTSGELSPTRTYQLHVENTRPSDIVTGDGIFWVTDDGKDQVFVYDIRDDALRYLGRWSLDMANADASGITLDPSGAE